MGLTTSVRSPTARNCIIEVISHFEPMEGDSLEFSVRAPDGERSEVSLFDMGTASVNILFSSQVLSKMHYSDPSDFSSRNQATRAAALSLAYKRHQRSSILMDGKSPIRMKPSVRHISFGDVVAPTLPSGAPRDINSSLLLPWFENPPFLSRNLVRLRERIGSPTLPPLNFQPTAAAVVGKPHLFQIPLFKEAKLIPASELSELMLEEIDDASMPLPNIDHIRHDSAEGDVTSTFNGNRRRCHSFDFEAGLSADAAAQRERCHSARRPTDFG
jgi:hypothetical protein